MEKKDYNAFPICGEGINTQWGVTKREYFALHLMAGILSGYDLDKAHAYEGIQEAAKASLFGADYLLKALAESEAQNG